MQANRYFTPTTSRNFGLTRQLDKVKPRRQGHPEQLNPQIG
jgi:hypothetical protein